MLLHRRRTTSLNSFTRADVRAVITSKVEVERCQTVMPKLAESCAEESDASCHCHTPHDRAAVDPHRDLRGGIKIVSMKVVGYKCNRVTHTLSRAHGLTHPHHSMSGPLLPARIRDHVVAVLLVERNDVRLGSEKDVRMPTARRLRLDSSEDEGTEAPVLQRRVD